MDFMRLVFIGSAAGLMLLVSFAVGLYSGSTRNEVFRVVKSLRDDLTTVYEELTGQGDDAFLYIVPEDEQTTVRKAEGAELAPGLLFMSAAEVGDVRTLRVLDRDGRVIHEWRPDWFEIWGDRGGFAEGRRPKSRQPLIHGARVLPNGDVVFNYSYLSTVRMTPCGDVVWALENGGHHSVDLAEDGTIWVSGAKRFDPPADAQYVNQVKVIEIDTLQNLSMDGEVLREIELHEIFVKNDLMGLVHLSTIDNKSTAVSGDIYHLNDVEAFPSNLDSEVFAPGDLMMSLRNINAVLVIDPDTLEVKLLSIGHFLRQHDPEFLPGDRISVFDNHNLWPAVEMDRARSRIVEIDARTGAASIFVGEGETPNFHTRLGGKHQRLAHGGALITVSGRGKIYEVDAEGRETWLLYNRLPSGRAGHIASAYLLPEEMDEAFFTAATASCAK